MRLGRRVGRPRARLKMAERVMGLMAVVLMLCPVALWPQVMMTGAGPGGTVQLYSSDEVILEIRDPRRDLPCVVNPIDPVLGFDLRFHGGYEVKIPFRELAGPENLLTVLFRITPAEGAATPVFFFQRFHVPQIEEDTRGEATLEGFFDVGEGTYQVDWLIRDRTERVCSSYWTTTAALPGKDRDVRLTVSPNQVAQAQSEYFWEEPPVSRVIEEKPLSVKVLVNFAPQKEDSAVLEPWDKGALVSILRSISRQPQFASFSLVAFNLREQRVFYRQANADRIDFPGLGEGLDTLKFGTVRYEFLAKKDSETQFLSRLIREELGGPSRPDAVIFAGPKTLVERKLPESALRELGAPGFPVFYMNYNLYPQSVPWRDAIGNAVKYWKGVEYTISKPRDLWFAVADIASKIMKLRGADGSVQAAQRRTFRQ